MKRLIIAAVLASLPAWASDAHAQTFGGQQQTGTGTGAATGLGGTAATGIGSATIPELSFGAQSFGSVGQGGTTGLGQFGGLGGGLGGIGGLGGLGGFGGMGGFGGGLGGGLGGRGFQTQNQNQNQDNKIRATVKIGFDYAAPPAAVRETVINTRLQRIPLPAKFNTVRVEMAGRKAVVVGTVPTTEDGKLIERLLSLEPGIDTVDNQLVYASGERNDPRDAPERAARPVVPPSSNSAPPSVPGTPIPLQQPPIIELVPVPVFPPGLP